MLSELAKMLYVKDVRASGLKGTCTGLHSAQSHFRTVSKLNNKRKSISLDFTGPVPQAKEFLDKQKSRNSRKKFSVTGWKRMTPVVSDIWILDLNFVASLGKIRGCGLVRGGGVAFGVLKVHAPPPPTSCSLSEHVSPQLLPAHYACLLLPCSQPWWL